MKIVIDIPDEMYDWMQKTNPEDDERRLIYIRDALALSAPLPKEHGRLIDADELEIDIGYEGYSAEQIENAPAIIKSNKEVEK